MNILSLFCGGGGLDSGAVNAGMRIVEAHEWDKAACEGYRLVMGHDCEQTDIARKLPQTFADSDIIIGGPPCQAFSQGNKYASPENIKNLWPATIEIMRVKRPSMFVFENVTGLVFKHAAYFNWILDQFKAMGYRVEWRVLNAADYGVPQTRQRVFIVGRKDNKPWCWPAPTHTKANTLFSQKWISWFEALPDGWVDRAQTKKMPIWAGKERYQAIPDTALVNVRDQFKTRLHRGKDEPSMTVTTESDKRFRVVIDGTVYAANSELISALQTFPQLGLSSKILGNAVPIKLAETIFNAMDHI